MVTDGDKKKEILDKAEELAIGLVQSMRSASDEVGGVPFEDPMMNILASLLTALRLSGVTFEQMTAFSLGIFSSEQISRQIN